jgi:hypothetical protein
MLASGKGRYDSDSRVENDDDERAGPVVSFPICAYAKKKSCVAGRHSDKTLLATASATTWSPSIEK